MKYKNILITGGAGFVGSYCAIKLKQTYADIRVVVLDNLKRRGSELNIVRFPKAGVEFIHGDVRNKEDFEFKASDKIDLILECSAEPSVLAGLEGSSNYLINTNLMGAVNCFELARKNKADVIFLSTSRVYPVESLNKLNYREDTTRFSLTDDQPVDGASSQGISEIFPLAGCRSLYGTSKLSAELILQEYIGSYGLKGVINRCGVITGPGQFGKIDQGVVVLWLAKHIFKQDLSYIGYGGLGKQVRDFIHIDDLFEVMKMQMEEIDKFNNQIFNIGGGLANSISLLELTGLCQEITGHKIKISSTVTNRPNDVRIYLSDCKKFENLTAWESRRDVKQTLTDIYKWIIDNETNLRYILG